MRSAEFVEQLRVRGALLEGIELLAMEVLQQRVAQECVVVRVANDRRDRREAGLLGGPQATLTHNEFVAGTGGANDHRLQEADFAQGVCEFGKRGLVKYLTGLLGVGRDVVDGQLGKPGAWHFEERLFFEVDVRPFGAWSGSPRLGVRDRRVRRIRLAIAAPGSRAVDDRRGRNQRTEAAPQAAATRAHRDSPSSWLRSVSAWASASVPVSRAAPRSAISRAASR